MPRQCTFEPGVPVVSPALHLHVLNEQGGRDGSVDASFLVTDVSEGCLVFRCKSAGCGADCSTAAGRKAACGRVGGGAAVVRRPPPRHSGPFRVKQGARSAVTKIHKFNDRGVSMHAAVVEAAMTWARCASAECSRCSCRTANNNIACRSSWTSDIKTSCQLEPVRRMQHSSETSSSIHDGCMCESPVNRRTSHRWLSTASGRNRC